MIDKDHIEQLRNGTVLDSEGNKIGSVGMVYFDDHNGQPDWATVKMGLFGTSEPFVPLKEATLNGDDIRLPFLKDKVKEAPRVDADQHLDVEQERELYRYYGLDYDDAGDGQTHGDDTGYGQSYDADMARAKRGEEVGIPEQDVSARGADEAMTRSEEHLHVGTATREAGRVRLRRYVVTEEQTVTVPVSHEEARIERVPITDENRDAAMSGGSIGEADHEITLHEERPVVEKEVKPVEKVRLETETVTEDQSVTEEVRKERIEAESDVQRHER